MTTEIFILLIAFQLKHFIADYPMQMPYMYMTKGKEKGWIKGLHDHAMIHAAFTSIIVFAYCIPYRFNVDGYTAFMITAEMIIFDYTTHFVTDRWKATRKADISSSFYWIYLGIDQMIHHIVGIFIIYTITTF